MIRFASIDPTGIIRTRSKAILALFTAALIGSIAHAEPAAPSMEMDSKVHRFSGPQFSTEEGRIDLHGERQSVYRVFFKSQSFIEQATVEAPRFTVVKLDDPARIIVDVLRSDVTEVDAPLEPLTGPIKQLSALQLKGKGGPFGRLIFTLDHHLEHRVVIDDQGLSLELDIPYSEELMLTAAPSAGQPLVSETESTASTESVVQQETSQARPSSTTRAPAWRALSASLKFVADGTSLSGEDETHFQLKLAPQDATSILPTPLLDDQIQRRPHLILDGVRLPGHLERRLDARELGGPIQFVSTLRDQSDDSDHATLHVVTELQRDAAFSVHYVDLPDNEVMLTWVFTSVSPAHEGLAQAMDMADGKPSGAPVFSSGDTPGPRSPTSRRRKKRYLGKRIKINIKDADIHNVLRFLADCGQVNIVTSDDVEGKVTLMLNQVPWDQALDIILRSKGLDMVREGNIIRVAPREAIAAERKAELEKTQIKEQLKPIMIRLLTVNHAEGKEMVTQVQGVLSERGTVSFDARTNTLIIKDIEEHIEAAEDLVKRLDTQTPQVLIEARIVEVNKVNEEELGIQWGGGFNGVVGTGNATGRAFPSSVGLIGAADDPQFQTPGFGATPNFMINLPATVGAGSGGALGLSLGSVDGAFNLNVRLSAAASRGTVKIVSSPKITTLDNRKALISQGVSIPISQVSAQGVQTVFFDATLKLEVTPHVTQDGNIYLQLLANNDTPDFQNVGSRGDPTILKKEASTQVLLQDGETTVIGGIYTSNAGYGSTEWPLLAQIPILGALFRKTDRRSQRNELLIFITPRVINRTASRVKTR